MVSKEPYHAGDICTLSLGDRMSVGPFCGRQTNIYSFYLLFLWVAFSFSIFFGGEGGMLVQPVSGTSLGSVTAEIHYISYLKGQCHCKNIPAKRSMFFKDKTKSPHLHFSKYQKN